MTTIRKESVMVRWARILLLLAALGGPAVTTVRAQAPAAPEAVTLPAPHVLAPAPPAPTFAPTPWPGPYFEPDPLLDRPPLPPPGWFADADLGVVIPHVKNHLSGPVQLGVIGPLAAVTAAHPDTVALPGAGLDWTVFPRLEVGYQLPSGFGAVGLSYRFLGTEGSGTAAVLDRPAALHSRLDLNEIGLDYSSNETSLWPNWDMKWALGLRMLWVYFDSRALAAGGPVFEQQESNWYAGFGPHTGLELDRQIGCTGLSLVLRGDFSIYMGRLNQRFSEAAGGAPLIGETREALSQAVVSLGTFVGVRWQPPQWKEAEFYFGYQYEHWWDIGKNDNTTSSAELNVQGVFVRAVWHF
jgi:hypothetical protein